MNVAARTDRGFTLVELIVVVIILAVAATIVAPRLVDRSGRAAELSARALADLVSAVGTRAALGGQRLALHYDSRENRVVPESWTFRGAPADFAAGGEWTPDPVLAAVTLNELEVRSIVVGGEPLTPASWRIESRTGEPAPAVSITVGAPRATRSWVIDLTPGSLRADLRNADSPGLTPGEDLDARGLDKEPW